MTLLAGSVRFGEGYHLWQPFAGGFQFVCLQGWGWLLFSTCLSFAIIVLANNVPQGGSEACTAAGGPRAALYAGVTTPTSLAWNYISGDGGAWIGGFELTGIGVLGFVAQLLLNLSNASFVLSPRPNAHASVHSLFNAKSFLAVLLALGGFSLSVLCDRLRQTVSPATSFVLFIGSCTAFLFATAVTHLIHGKYVLLS